MRGLAKRGALLALALASAACAHPGEAFDERVGQNLSDGFARVALRCEPPAPAPIAGTVRLMLGETSGPGDQRALLTPHAFIPASASGELVGEVFGQGSGMTRWSAPFALGLAGPPLAAQLASELHAHLAAAGIEVVGADPRAPARDAQLSLSIQRVWVHSLSGGFFALKGDLVADVQWRAEVRPPAEARVIWRRDVARRVERRIFYAYARDHEEALREAWCAAIAELATAAEAELVPLLAPR